MTRIDAKTTTALVGALALAASAAAGAAPVSALAEAPHQAPSEATERTEAPASEGFAPVAHVQGAFSFDQGVLTSTADITNRFSKAAASLCSNMPTYFETCNAHSIRIGGDIDANMDATLSELAAEEGTEAYEMACSCASNVAGGGAIANAEVEGVSLASIARVAGAY